MKRILVVDDERPVIEGISLMVRRELGGAFEVAGSAMSGREAIEKAMTLVPDIILMDVRMPGISGLDAIREIRKRGSAAAFILVTAYERFDIARYAVELGVIDYLLKPISKDGLAQALRNAAQSLERRSESERREIEHREREETMRGFVEVAFLHGIMLGERFGPDLARYCGVLGIQDPCALVAAVAFLPPAAADLQGLHERFRTTVRYKTRAIAGPLVSGHAVVLLPLKDEASAPESLGSLRTALIQAHRAEFERGHLRLGFSAPAPLEQVGGAWAEAVADLLGGRGEKSRPGLDPAFGDDEAFLEALLTGSPEKAALHLERMLERLRPLQPLPSCERYRLIALFGSACRILARRGLLEAEAALGLMDCEDLHAAPAGPTLELAVRARFSRLAEALGRKPQWSPTVARAIALVRENFGRPMSLESTAFDLGISPNRLSRIFSEETGKGFSDYLIEYRIERAKELLLLPGASIKQVSITCGYPDPNYFSRLFKKVTGLTPTTFSSGTEAGDAPA
jgi:two-component system response regulator YesN